MELLNDHPVLVAATVMAAVYLAKTIYKTVASRRMMRDLVGSFSSEEDRGRLRQYAQHILHPTYA
jgi:hypothetical protein